MSLTFPTASWSTRCPWWQLPAAPKARPVVIAPAEALRMKGRGRRSDRRGGSEAQHLNSWQPPCSKALATLAMG